MGEILRLSIATMLLASILLRRGLCDEDELQSGNEAETTFIDLNENLSRVSSGSDFNSNNYGDDPWDFDQTTSEATPEPSSGHDFDQTTSTEATPEPSSGHDIIDDETSPETSNDNINNGVENPVSTAGDDDDTATSHNNEVSTEQSDSNQPAGSNGDQGLEVGGECTARTPYVGTEDCSPEACLLLCGVEYSVAICDFRNYLNLGVFCCCDPIHT